MRDRKEKEIEKKRERERENETLLPKKLARKLSIKFRH